MKIALGSDHRGVEAARALLEYFRGNGHEPYILGDCTGKPSDYPDSAYLVGEAVSSGEADCGMLICGSGIGMSMAANKVQGVRAAAAYDEFLAEMCRRHNNANVLCMSGDLCTITQLYAIAEAFLATEFEGGRHDRRVGKMAVIEKGKDPTKAKAASTPA